MQRRPKQSLTWEVVKPVIHLKLHDAAMALGVCDTTLKNWSRVNDIPKWPARRIKRLQLEKERLQERLKRHPRSRHSYNFQLKLKRVNEELSVNQMGPDHRKWKQYVARYEAEKAAQMNGKAVPFTHPPMNSGTSPWSPMSPLGVRLNMVANGVRPPPPHSYHVRMPVACAPPVSFPNFMGSQREPPLFPTSGSGGRPLFQPVCANTDPSSWPIDESRPYGPTPYRPPVSTPHHPQPPQPPRQPVPPSGGGVLRFRGFPSGLKKRRSRPKPTYFTNESDDEDFEDSDDIERTYTSTGLVVDGNVRDDEEFCDETTGRLILDDDVFDEDREGERSRPRSIRPVIDMRQLAPGHILARPPNLRPLPHPGLRPHPHPQPPPQLQLRPLPQSQPDPEPHGGDDDEELGPEEFADTDSDFYTDFGHPVNMGPPTALQSLPDLTRLKSEGAPILPPQSDPRAMHFRPLSMPFADPPFIPFASRPPRPPRPVNRYPHTHPNMNLRDPRDPSVRRRFY